MTSLQMSSWTSWHCLKRGSMCTDTINCIKRDIAPEGFSVLHVHRSGTTGRPWSGGGLAIIYRSTLDVSVHPRFKKLCTSTSSCEIQLVRLGRASSSLTIANIYLKLVSFLRG